VVYFKAVSQHLDRETNGNRGRLSHFLWPRGRIWSLVRNVHFQSWKVFCYKPATACISSTRNITLSLLTQVHASAFIITVSRAGYLLLPPEALCPSPLLQGMCNLWAENCSHINSLQCIKNNIGITEIFLQHFCVYVSTWTMNHCDVTPDVFSSYMPRARDRRCFIIRQVLYHSNFEPDNNPKAWLHSNTNF
jgi:hypothetical protein